ncbi:hypothetical protein B5S28_g1496 [[Candida] boidinii]|nr:hypothetical protein B5S28_g1496 [[Candida] boidinii]OWB59836.1 hypothetical protein B5S29_g701 [[Candida] boidinii]OWB70988.1 hypothetical protein B5S31_g669 [[Candida] boidinii]OWB78612.1 hypothetical protein B5S32_g2809 [[Candida] boidinii]GMF71763.1 unnamed protein product [[Candida] boidinii]
MSSSSSIPKPTAKNLSKNGLNNITSNLNSSAISDSEDIEDIDGSELPRKVRRSSSMSSIFSLHEEPLPPIEQKDIIAFTSDDRHFSMLRNLHMADFITLLNGFSGFYSIISCLRFTLTTKPHYLQRAIFFIVLGLIFDFMDGKVARLRNKSSLMGQELDSLADLISFGVAPASIAFSIGLQTTVDVLFLTFCVLCGLARLARFNVTVANIPKDDNGKSKYFEGFPIPTSLWLVALMSFFISQNWIESINGSGLVGGLILKDTFFELHPLSVLFFLQGCCMISKSLKIPKP